MPASPVPTGTLTAGRPDMLTGIVNRISSPVWRRSVSPYRSASRLVESGVMWWMKCGGAWEAVVALGEPASTQTHPPTLLATPVPPPLSAAPHRMIGATVPHVGAARISHWVSRRRMWVSRRARILRAWM